MGEKYCTDQMRHLAVGVVLGGPIIAAGSACSSSVTSLSANSNPLYFRPASCMRRWGSPSGASLVAPPEPSGGGVRGAPSHLWPARRVRLGPLECERIPTPAPPSLLHAVLGKSFGCTTGRTHCHPLSQKLLLLRLLRLRISEDKSSSAGPSLSHWCAESACSNLEREKGRHARSMMPWQAAPMNTTKNT